MGSISIWAAQLGGRKVLPKAVVQGRCSLCSCQHVSPFVEQRSLEHLSVCLEVFIKPFVRIFLQCSLPRRGVGSLFLATKNIGIGYVSEHDLDI